MTLLRNKESHSEQVQKVQTTRGKSAESSRLYGVNRDSKLNELGSFHVTENVPPDLMHDILEGVLPLTIKRLLKYLITSKIFTLDLLNKKIKDFDFDYMELSDKPSEILSDHLTDDGTIHQSAGQMWLLVVMLPSVLGPLVSSEDKCWNNFLNLLEICRIVFSEQVTLWMVSYLKDLIQIYVTETTEVYNHLIPKMHHLVHYPTQILRFGSLIGYMCMGCEAKHKFFKQLVIALGNYKNIPLSLAEKHQMNQSYVWSNSLRKYRKCGPQTSVDVDLSPLKGVLPLNCNTIVETKWLEWHGLKFIPERCFIAVGCDTDCMPVFAKVMMVIVDPSILFVCSNMTTIQQDVQCSSFRIEVLESCVVYKPEDMVVHAVFHGHCVQGNMNIFIKTCIGESF